MQHVLLVYRNELYSAESARTNHERSILDSIRPLFTPSGDETIGSELGEREVTYDRHILPL